VVEEEILDGTSFCNSDGFPYRLRDGALVLDALAGTEMGCAAEVMEAETTYLRALRAGGLDVTVESDGPVLRLPGAPVGPGRAGDRGCSVTASGPRSTGDRLTVTDEGEVGLVFRTG
jgi:hypothetical protein